MLEFTNLLVVCGDSGLDIPDSVFNLVHYVILVIQIVVPILLIIWGMLDFAKGLTKGKAEDIKAGQKTFISRLIVAVVVFLIVTATTIVIQLVAKVSGNDSGAPNDNTLTSCLCYFTKGADATECAGKTAAGMEQ